MDDPTRGLVASAAPRSTGKTQTGASGIWFARCSAPRNPRGVSPPGDTSALSISSRREPYAACQLSRYQAATRSLTSWSVTTTQPQCCVLPPDGPRIAVSRTAHSTSSGIGSGERYLREGVECSASSAVSDCSPAVSSIECDDIIGSRGALVEGVGVEALKFVEEHPLQRLGRERALEEAADPGRAVPARRDANQRLVALRLDVERIYQTRVGVGLDQRAARLRLSDPHTVVAGPPTRGDREAGDGARAHAAFFYLEVRERGRQETRVLVHVRQMSVYLLCGGVDRALSGSLHFCHGPMSTTGARPGLSRAAAQLTDEHISGNRVPRRPFVDVLEANGVGQFSHGLIGCIR